MPHTQQFQHTIYVPKLTSNTQLLRQFKDQLDNNNHSNNQDKLHNHKNNRMNTSLEATIQVLKTQIGQLATTVNEIIQQKSNATPAQPLVNLKSGTS